MDLNERIQELKPYHLNCNVFSVYDYDGLTMQELLCQFFTVINECIKAVNKTLDLAEWLVNEGLSKEVALKLEKWLADGTLSEIINEKIFNELNLKLNKKIEIIVSEELPQINQRKDYTYYFKVTKKYGSNDGVNSGNCGNIKVSPNMGLRVEGE